jgi:hypothetical protein
MSERDGHVCPACGWPGLRERPWQEGFGYSFEICPCCFFQFGHDDEAEGWTYDRWRADWIATGMLWASREPRPPEGWDPLRQLANLGEVDVRRPPWWRRLIPTPGPRRARR